MNNYLIILKNVLPYILIELTLFILVLNINFTINKFINNIFIRIFNSLLYLLFIPVFKHNSIIDILINKIPKLYINMVSFIIVFIISIIILLLNYIDYKINIKE